eukprot:scaffold18987_cov109-Isochrysis_galbana.AAC.16
MCGTDADFRRPDIRLRTPGDLAHRVAGKRPTTSRRSGPCIGLLVTVGGVTWWGKPGDWRRDRRGQRTGTGIYRARGTRHL